MAKTRRFTRDELKEQFEAIEDNWHRHGDEAKEVLQDFIEAIYESLPEDSKEPDPAVADQELVELDLNELDRRLTEALKPVFSEADTMEEFREFVGWLEAEGAEISSEDVLTVRRRVLREIFDLRFNSQDWHEELISRIQPIREWLKV